MFCCSFQDLARDTRETKVHYSPSEKDGVFVVEVARGADSSAASQITRNHEEIKCQSSVDRLEEVKRPASIEKNGPNGIISSVSKGNEEVLVHPPPMNADDDVLTVDEDGAVSMASSKLNGNSQEHNGKINTGLSQSDLSISSSTNSNQGYCYGSQEDYTVESKDYQSTSPHHNHIEIIATPCVDSKPVITAAIFKQDSVDPVALIEPILVTIKSGSQAIELVEPVPLTIEPTEQHSEQFTEQSNTDGALLEKPSKIENGSIPAMVECLPKENGNCDKADETRAVDDETGDFDSLINLPAPPTCDEIKQLNEITSLEGNNLDSLPPPPPEVIVEVTTINGQS